MTRRLTDAVVAAIEAAAEARMLDIAEYPRLCPLCHEYRWGCGETMCPQPRPPSEALK